MGTYPETTQALVVDDFDDRPHTASLPVPALAPTEALIRVHAASVNAFDWKQASGMFRNTFEYRFPLTIGRDYAGVVVAVGDQVSRVDVGDEVFGYFTGRQWHRGSFAEHVWVDEGECFVRKPDGLGFVAAACLPLSGVVALRCVDAVRPSADDVVLVVGAPGGVGSYVVQLAAQRGAHVIATGPESDEEYLAGLGAAEIVRPGDSLAKEIEIRHPGGIDCLVDLVNRGDAFVSQCDVLAAGGRAASLHWAVDDEAFAARGLSGANIGSMPDRDLLTRLGEVAAENTLRVPIEGTYPLSRAAEALEALKTQHARGKLVLSMLS